MGLGATRALVRRRPLRPVGRCDRAGPDSAGLYQPHVEHASRRAAPVARFSNEGERLWVNEAWYTLEVHPRSVVHGARVESLESLHSGRPRPDVSPSAVTSRCRTTATWSGIAISRFVRSDVDSITGYAQLEPHLLAAGRSVRRPLHRRQHCPLGATCDVGAQAEVLADSE